MVSKTMKNIFGELSAWISNLVIIILSPGAGLIVRGGEGGQ